jgi:hypothetical protein
MEKSGNIQKLITSLEDTVQYHLPIGDDRIALNPFIGNPITLPLPNAIVVSSNRNSVTILMALVANPNGVNRIV